MFGSHRSGSNPLEQEIQVMTRRLEKLKRKAAKESRHGFAHFRQGADGLLNHSQEHWQSISDEGRKLSKQAKQCVEQNPGASVAVGIGALVVLGLLLCRR